MSLKIKTPPVEEPITIADIKAYLDIDDTDDDTLLTGLIAAMREKCESYTGRLLITQTWTLYLDSFPSRERSDAPKEGIHQLPADYFNEQLQVIEVPRPPLQSVAHIKTFDNSNSETVFDSSNYIVDTNSEPGRISLNSGKTWPSSLRSMNGIEIEFIAGYGLASSVPNGIKQGIRIWIQSMLDNKNKSSEADDSGNRFSAKDVEEIPPEVKALWNPYQLVKL